MSKEQLAGFYAKSAANLERVYDEPGCQDDLAELREAVAQALRGHVVLELACGGGYWTEVIAQAADSVVAIDINPGLVELAQQRGVGGKLRFRVADALDLPDDIGEFTAVFAGFYWSHLERDEQLQLVAQLRKRFGKDVLLVLADDTYVEGISETVARTDAQGTTWQIVVAPDGERCEIPKSYPSDSALRKRLAPSVREIRILRLECYWLLSCRLK